jgi:hypothetical protein
MSAPGATGGTGSGELEEERDGAKGDYKVEWGANGAEYRATGDLDLTRRDNGPGKKATYTLAGEMNIRLTRGDEMVTMMAKPMSSMMRRGSRHAGAPGVNEGAADSRLSAAPCHEPALIAVATHRRWLYRARPPAP